MKTDKAYKNKKKKWIRRQIRRTWNVCVWLFWLIWWVLHDQNYSHVSILIPFFLHLSHSPYLKHSFFISLFFFSLTILTKQNNWKCKVNVFVKGYLNICMRNKKKKKNLIKFLSIYSIIRTCYFMIVATYYRSKISGKKRSI